MRMSRRAGLLAKAEESTESLYEVRLWDIINDTDAGLYGTYEPGAMVTVDVSQGGLNVWISSVEPYSASISESIEYELVGDSIARFAMPEFDVAVLVEFM